MLQPVDRTEHSPQEYRVRTREPREVDLVVLHQTGTPHTRKDAPILDRVRAHVLVLSDGEVRLLHPLLTRMRYGSSIWNQRCITVECQGNYPTRYTTAGKPVWWSPDTAGAHNLADHPEQVQAVRDVLAWLPTQLPQLRYLAAHRQIEASKGGCCGPDLWRECGEYALEHLGYTLMTTDKGGSDLPDTWRRQPTMVQGTGKPSPFAPTPP